MLLVLLIAYLNIVGKEKKVAWAHINAYTREKAGHRLVTKTGNKEYS